MRITAVAPTTSSFRRYPPPCLLIPPSRSLPPELFGARGEAQPCGGADAGDSSEPAACIIGPVAGKDLRFQSIDLACQRSKAARQCREVPIAHVLEACPASLEQLQQRGYTSSPLAGDNTVLRQMRPQGVDQRGTLANQQIAVL